MFVKDEPAANSDEEDEDAVEEDEGITGPSSVVRLQTVRVVAVNDRRSLGGSRKALTPVRRSTRLLNEEDDEENASTMLELLQQSDMTYVPNPSLQGSHFVKREISYRMPS